MFYIKETNTNQYLVKFDGAVASLWTNIMDDAQFCLGRDTACCLLQECKRRHMSDDFTIVERFGGVSYV